MKKSAEIGYPVYPGMSVYPELPEAELFLGADMTAGAGRAAEQAFDRANTRRRTDLLTGENGRHISDVMKMTVFQDQSSGSFFVFPAMQRKQSCVYLTGGKDLPKEYDRVGTAR